MAKYSPNFAVARPSCSGQVPSSDINDSFAVLAAQTGRALAIAAAKCGSYRQLGNKEPQDESDYEG